MKSVLLVLGGPLLWLATWWVASGIGSRRCGDTGAVMVALVLALAGCVAILYHALRRIRRTDQGLAERDRQWHFAAGLTAVMSMTGIGATSLASLVAAHC